MNPYVLFLSAAALWYLPTAIALLRMDFSFEAFEVQSIQADYIDVSLRLRLKNNTFYSVSVSSIAATVFFNEREISKLQLNTPLTVPGNGSATAVAALRIHSHPLKTLFK